MSNDKVNQLQPDELAFVDRMIAQIVTEAASTATHPEDYDRLLAGLTLSLIERVKAGVNASCFESRLQREAAEANPLFKKFLDEKVNAVIFCASPYSAWKGALPGVAYRQSASPSRAGQGLTFGTRNANFISWL